MFSLTLGSWVLSGRMWKTQEKSGKFNKTFRPVIFVDPNWFYGLYSENLWKQCISRKINDEKILECFQIFLLENWFFALKKHLIINLVILIMNFKIKFDLWTLFTSIIRGNDVKWENLWCLTYELIPNLFMHNA